MKQKTKDGQMRSKKMADEVLETKEYKKPEVDTKVDEAIKATEARVEAEEVMVDRSVKQEGKEAENKVEEKAEKENKSILINPKKTGKIKIELLRNGRIYLTGKNIKDDDELPLFLVTYGINMMLEKDVKTSYIMSGILNYKPFREKMIVEQREGEQQKGLDTINKSSNEVNPLFGTLGSLMASMAASKASNNKDNKAKSNT